MSFDTLTPKGCNFVHEKQRFLDPSATKRHGATLLMFFSMANRTHSMNEMYYWRWICACLMRMEKTFEKHILPKMVFAKMDGDLPW